MTRTARQIAVASIAALAAVAAIIVADFTAPASAQNGESAGRIVARLLEDGRVEFGWQPAGGERVLPRQRYFPPDARVDRWLRSSPVEVEGAAIGRINARLLENGRIEFAFTPTDGERIEPQGRYFPANARVGRWLRSTEITIGPPATSYIAVSAGWAHTCAIRESGEIVCWGWNQYGETDAPDGSFTAVAAGAGHTCAIRDTGEITCWGLNGYYGVTHPTDGPFLVETGQADAPAGRFTAVSAGIHHTCAIRESGGMIECWGWSTQYGQANTPTGSFTAVSASDGYTCVIRDAGEIACWGNPSGEKAEQTDAPGGRFTAISTGQFHTCAIRESGELACWGSSYAGQADAPAGRFTAVSAGYRHTCAIRESDSAIECWGSNWYRWVDPATGEVNDIESEQATPPAGRFTAVSAGSGHACAIRESDSAIECWGWNEYGQATPPAD